MNYKEKNSASKEIFPFFDTCSDDYFQNTYDFQEWTTQIKKITDNFEQQNYEIYEIYEYITSSDSEIPYTLLIESHFLDNLLSHFNQLVLKICSIQEKKKRIILEIEEIIKIPEKQIEIVNPYLILCIKIIIFLLQTDFLIQNHVFDENFFYSISKLCFNRNKYCQIIQEKSKTLYSLCVESLKLVELLFKNSKDILLYFEKKFDFSYFINPQFIMARVFEIKYYSFAVISPWMPYHPGNKQVFDLYFDEMVKTIKNENSYIFKVKTSEDPVRNDSSTDSDNKFNLISLMLRGILKFIRTRPKIKKKKTNKKLEIKEEEEEEEEEEKTEEEEEEEENESRFIAMDYAYSRGVIKLASFAINTNFIPTILFGIKIINCYLSEKRIYIRDIELFLYEIRGNLDKLPPLLKYSEEVCREEVKMLKFFMEMIPRDEFESFFNDTFVSSILDILDDKEFKWKLYLYEFIGHLMIQMDLDFIEKLLKDVEIVDFFSDIRSSADNDVADIILDGFYRIIQDSPQLKQFLIDKGIEEELVLYVEDSDYTYKAQTILNLVQL